MHWKELLEAITSVLVIDWPSKEVPEALASAGLKVVVRGGPGPEDYSLYEAEHAGAVTRRSIRAPEQVDLVFVHRPLSELSAIIANAKDLHAKAIWIQSGLSATGGKDPRGCWLPDKERQKAVELVRAAELSCFSEPYLPDAIRELRALDV